MLLKLIFCIKIEKLNNNLCTLKQAILIHKFMKENFFSKDFTSDIK